MVLWLLSGFLGAVFMFIAFVVYDNFNVTLWGLILGIVFMFLGPLAFIIGIIILAPNADGPIIYKNKKG